MTEALDLTNPSPIRMRPAFAAGETHERLVWTEQVKLLYGNTVGILVANAVNAPLLGIVLWDHVPRALLGGWVLLVLISSLGRAYSVYRFHHLQPESEAIDPWWRRARNGTVISSALWGFAMIFLFPTDSFVHQVFLCFVAAGMSAGAVATLAPVPVAFHAYVLGLMAPLILRLIGVGDALHIVMAVMGGVYVGVLALVGSNVNRTLVRSLRLRYENFDLIERLDAARRGAEDANRSKSEFLANMSHELRTPLNAILGFAEVLRDGRVGVLDAARQHQYVDDIHASGTHLLRLINDILDLSKAEAGKLEAKDTRVEVPQLIENCVRMMGPEARRGRIDVKVSVPDGIKAIRADDKMMHQVLLNLLSNAIKFTPPEGTVEVSARADESGLAIAVIDTGVGMSPADIPKALEVFGQVDNAFNRRHAGTGLGLPLVRRLVELHGGSFTLTSQVGSGTTALVKLPAARLIP